MGLVLSLIASGVISFFFFNTANTGSALSIQNMDLMAISANNQVTLNVTILSAPISGGTIFLFPDLYTKIFSPTTIFSLMIGTVVMDRRSENKAPKLREVVQSEIDEHPGIHLRELQRNIGCAMGALQYHVKHLESSGDITSCRVGNAKHFFPSGYSSDEQVLKLSALSRNPTVRTILSEIVDQGRVTQAELSRTMSLDKSLISYYTNNLLKADVLNIVRVFGRERPLILSEWAHSIIESMALV